MEVAEPQSGEVKLSQVVAEACSLREGLLLKQGGADAVPVRLRNAILRILNRSLPKLKAHYLPPPSNGLVRSVCLRSRTSPLCCSLTIGPQTDTGAPSS